MPKHKLHPIQMLRCILLVLSSHYSIGLFVSKSVSTRVGFGSTLRGQQMHQSVSASRSTTETINHENAGAESFASPMRYSSRDAAAMIAECSAKDGLLVITTDASGRGGGSKHDGLAAVLRIRHGASNIPQTNTTTCQGGKVDLLDTITRRRTPSRKDSNEVAAISLGMKRAMQIVPRSWRRKVLIISDSEAALRFYCGDSRSSRDGGESHRRVLARLIIESPDGVFFSKIRSSSRSIGIVSSDADSDGDDKGWDGIGFVDHDAADYLSSATRSKPNAKMDFNLEESIELDELPFAEVYELRPEDIKWLKNSDDVVDSVGKSKTNGSTKPWSKITVRGSDARNEQRRRNERKQKMVKEMLGLEGL